MAASFPTPDPGPQPHYGPGSPTRLPVRQPPRGNQPHAPGHRVFRL